jgi:uncharacterized membrane protein YfcA
LDWIQLTLLAALGVIGGILNVIAGGGSLLTMPTMVLMEIPGPVANGTNRIAILAQNISAIAGFWRKGFSDFRLSLTLALAAIPGAVLGAWTGTKIEGVLFNRILAGIMIGVIALMIFKQVSARKKSATASAIAEDRSNKTRLILGHICMVGVGFYGGFIQAGVGFLLMAVLHNIMGLDLVRVNMHKVFIVAVYTVVALVVYIARDKILWAEGLVLAAGMATGGWIGANLSVNKGEGFIRVVLYLTLTAMAIKLLWG